jgi:hypothetical protein
MAPIERYGTNEGAGSRGSKELNMRDPWWADSKDLISWAIDPIGQQDWWWQRYIDDGVTALSSTETLVTLGNRPLQKWLNAEVYKNHWITHHSNLTIKLIKKWSHLLHYMHSRMIIGSNYIHLSKLLHGVYGNYEKLKF